MAPLLLPPPLFGLQRPRRVVKKDKEDGPIDDTRRIAVPRDARTFEFVEVFPDNYAQFIVLEDARGRGRCWRVGSQSAASLLESPGIVGADDLLFNSQRIRVFFPVVPSLMPQVGGLEDGSGDDAADNKPYFFGRYVTIRGNATLARVLQAVGSVAAQAIAWHLVEERGWRSATYGDVRRCLRDYVICRLLCRRSGGDNRVYVRLA